MCVCVCVCLYTLLHVHYLPVPLFQHTSITLSPSTSSRHASITGTAPTTGIFSPEVPLPSPLAHRRGSGAEATSRRSSESVLAGRETFSRRRAAILDSSTTMARAAGGDIASTVVAPIPSSTSITSGEQTSTSTSSSSSSTSASHKQRTLGRRVEFADQLHLVTANRTRQRLSDTVSRAKPSAAVSDPALHAGQRVFARFKDNHFYTGVVGALKSQRKW